MRSVPAWSPVPALALTLLALAAGTLAMAPARRLPAIVFVSRNPIAGDPGAIPGLGPHHRAAITGGRLLVREPDGRVRELLPAGRFEDVSDPSVSPDGRTIAFAGVTRDDRSWRLFLVGVDGTGLRAIPAHGPPPFAELDPCWIDDSTLVFASTRDHRRAQYADVPVTNLFLLRLAGPDGVPVRTRLTSERNGAEEPAFDRKQGEIVFARWWFNPWRAAANASGITDQDELALPRDTVNLWHAMAVPLEGGPARLAAADLRTRRGAMGYQPAVLPDGSVVSVYAANLGLSPAPIATGLHRQSPRFGRAERLAGAIVSGREGDSYAGTEGLAAPAACSPAVLPDGRVLFSYAPGGRGDLGLHVMNARGSAITRVLDLPGTLELDAAPIVPWRPSSRSRPANLDPVADLEGGVPAFRFHALDVFGERRWGSAGRGAPPRTPGTRLRFFTTVAGRDGSADSAVLVHVAPVGPGGEVDVRLPAGMPMFEQLVDSTGRVLMTAHGPAHVAGSNAGVPRTTSRCVGCHLGHSTLPARDGQRVAKRASRRPSPPASRRPSPPRSGS